MIASIFALDPAQRLWDQGGAGAAKPDVAVAGGAMFGEERGAVRLGKRRGGQDGPGKAEGHRKQVRRNDVPDHGSCPGRG